MKAKAIIRIIACIITFLLLLSILCGVLFMKGIFIGPSGERTTYSRKIDVADFQKLEIDWAAGSITITKAITAGEIIITETKDSNNPCTMSVDMDDDTLSINYGRSDLTIGNVGSKDLVITVPSTWSCDVLEIDGAALDIDIKDLTVDTMEVDGAANKICFQGKLNRLQADGMAVKLDLTTVNAPEYINLDGMGCSLDLTLPANAGFDATLEGAGVSFQSQVSYNKQGNHYTFANKECKIDASGMGCEVTVNYA